jgi:cysteine desulfurase/selenocysteine lyase
MGGKCSRCGMLSKMSTIWDDVREDFPAVKRCVYLNAAAHSPTPRPVREAVTGFYRELEEGVDWWERWIERREDVRGRVARLLNAEPDEIAFAPNTSTGMNLIVDLIGGEGAVLTDEIEFPTMTLPWVYRGITVHFMPVVEGVVRQEFFGLEQAPRAATIAISHVQFSNGCRQDLVAFGAIKGPRRLVVNGSQSIGAFPVDVRQARIDALATAGHKWLCAGYGAGFLFVDRALLAARPPAAIGWLSVEDPFSFENRSFKVLSEARRVEMGCPPLGGIFALGAAVRYLTGVGLEQIAQRVLELNAYLTTCLDRQGFSLLSPGGEYRSGETLCALPHPKRAVAFLNDLGIVVTPKPEGVRISTHFFNNHEEIDACVRGLVEYRKTLPA